MGLGIFSFDLAAMIGGLPKFIEAPDPEIPPPTNEVSPDAAEEIPQNASVAAFVIDDEMTAAALGRTVTFVIAAPEIDKKQGPAPLPPTTYSTARAPLKTDEEIQKEIECLIKSLQTSVIHNYKVTDMIDENSSIERTAKFPKRELREDRENKKESAEQEKKMEDRKSELLREEFKRLKLKKISNV
jgi:hypothetical protein